MTLVVDARVALKWFLADEPQLIEARGLLNGPETLIAPDLIVAEVCNAAWRGVRVHRIRQQQAEGIAGSVPGLFASLIPAAGLAERAVVISIQLDLAVYDCFYLALAEIRDVPLITTDERLLRRLQGTAWAARAQPLADYRRGG